MFLRFKKEVLTGQQKTRRPKPLVETTRAGQMIEQPTAHDFVNANYMIYHGPEHRGPFRGRVATMAAAEGWQTALGGDETIEVVFCLTRQMIAWLCAHGEWAGGSIRSPDGETDNDWNHTD